MIRLHVSQMRMLGLCSLQPFGGGLSEWANRSSNAGSELRLGGCGLNRRGAVLLANGRVEEAKAGLAVVAVYNARRR